MVFESGMESGKDAEVNEYNLDRYGRMAARVLVNGRDMSL